MKLSTKSRYALRSMIAIATRADIVSITEISNAENISERYLELIFSRLKKANLIKSIRGSKGGYQLSKPANEITVFDVFNVMEDNPYIVKENAKEDPIKNLLHNEIWTPIDTSLEAYLKSITLKDLL